MRTKSSRGYIRRVDFRNHAYHISKGLQGASETISVHNGELRRNSTDFKIVKVLYGDLTGHRHEEALVVARYAFEGANYYDTEIFLFGMTNGQVKQLANLNDADTEHDYRRYYKPDD